MGDCVYYIMYYTHIYMYTCTYLGLLGLVVEVGALHVAVVLEGDEGGVTAVVEVVEAREGEHDHGLHEAGVRHLWVCWLGGRGGIGFG